MRTRAFVLSLALVVTAAGLARTASAEIAVVAPRALTLWWVVFNEPDNCVTNPGAIEQCGEADVFGQPFLDSVANGTPDPTLIAPNVDAGLAVIYATGGRTTRTGAIRLVASIYRSAANEPLNLAGPSLVDPMGLGRAFDRTDAEVHLVVRDHGEVVDEDLSVQILNFLEPYCSDPNLGWHAGKNTCSDVQFAVFGPGESGVDAVYAFGDSSTPLRRASATLIRNGDMLQAIVETRVR